MTLSSDQYDIAAGRYTCCLRWAWKHKSDILIVAENKALTWQGRLEMQCRECLDSKNDEVTLGDWHKRCKRDWHVRKAEIQGWPTRCGT